MGGIQSFFFAQIGTSMKSTKKLASTLVTVLLTSLMLAGCGTSSDITYSYVDPVLKKLDLTGVMIVGVAQKESARVSFEDAFVTALSRNGVRAVASHTLLSEGKLTAEQLVLAAEAASLDTVLITRYMGEAAQDVYHPGTIYYGVTPAYGSGYYGGFGGYYGHAYEVAYQQPVWTSNVTHTVVSDLYIVETKGHVWQAVSDTIQAGSNERARNDAIKSLVGDLKDQGLLN